MAGHLALQLLAWSQELQREVCEPDDPLWLQELASWRALRSVITEFPGGSGQSTGPEGFKEESGSNLDLSGTSSEIMAECIQSMLNAWDSVDCPQNKMIPASGRLRISINLTSGTTKKNFYQNSP